MRTRSRSLAKVVPSALTACLLATVAASAHAEPAPVLPRGSVSASVDCAAGQSLATLLERLADRPRPIAVTITGVCAERVTLRRDDVILQGAAPGAGLTSPATGGGSLILLDGARRITLYQLTLTLAVGSHDSALELVHGAQVHVGNAVVEAAASPGLVLFDGTLAEVFDSRIRGTSAPVSQIQVTGAHLDLFGSTIENGRAVGVGVGRRGSLYVESSTITGNGSTGLSIGENSAATLVDSQVTSNRFGVSVFQNGTLQLAGTCRVADNEFDGLIGASGSGLSMGGGTVIENNRNGVRAIGGSNVQLANVAIQNNRESGVSLGDASVLSVAGSPTISGNAQWGIFCARPPAVPQVPVGIPVDSVTGNGAGATNCPPLGVVGWVP